MGALAAALLILIGLAQTSPGTSVLEDLGLIEAPERFTELSFVSPHALPEELPRNAEHELRFRLHNEEGERRAYRWSAEGLARPGGRVDALAAGQVTLAQGEGVIVERPLRIPCRSEREVIRVLLSDPAQSIRFAVNCAPPGS